MESVQFHPYQLDCCHLVDCAYLSVYFMVQVSHLLSLFHPITMQSSTQNDSSYMKDQFQTSARVPSSGSTYFSSMHSSYTPQVLVPQHVPQGVHQQWDSSGSTGNMGIVHYSVGSQPIVPAQPMKDQFQSSASLPSMKDPNAAWAYGGLSSPMLEPQYIQPSVLHPQYVSYGYTTNMGYFYPAVQPQAMPASTQTYYSAEFGQHHLAEVTAQPAPKSYERYSSRGSLILIILASFLETWNFPCSTKQLPS